MNNVKYVLGKESLSPLYASIPELHLTYCVEVWVNAYKNNMNLLYLRQRCVICLVSKSGYLDHAANLFQSLNVLPFFMC